MTIRILWEHGDLASQVEGQIVASDVPWAEVGQRVIVDAAAPYQDNEHHAAHEARGYVLRFPNQGNTQHHIQDPVRAPGDPAHLVITLTED